VGQIHLVEDKDRWHILVNFRVHCGNRVSHKAVAEGLVLNGIWHYVVGRVVPGVSTVHKVFVFRIKQSSEDEGTAFLLYVGTYSPVLNGMWHYVVGRVVPGVSTVHRVFIFGIKQSSEDEGTAFLLYVGTYSPKTQRFIPMQT